MTLTEQLEHRRDTADHIAWLEMRVKDEPRLQGQLDALRAQVEPLVIPSLAEVMDAARRKVDAALKDGVSTPEWFENVPEVKY
jgi:hypothetical protein